MYDVGSFKVARTFILDENASFIFISLFIFVVLFLSYYPEREREEEREKREIISP